LEKNLCDQISNSVLIKWKLHRAFLGKCHIFHGFVAVEMKCVKGEVLYVAEGPLSLRMIIAVSEESLILLTVAGDVKDVPHV
jgi:hypothetical protein